MLEKVAIPSPGNLLDLGIEPASPVLQANSLPLSHQGIPNRENLEFVVLFINLSENSFLMLLL